MKLSAVKAKVSESERVATLVIYQPDGEPYRSKSGEECTLSFTGSESKAYRIERERIQRRSLNRRQTKVDPADILKNRVDLAAAPLTGWTGWEDDDDEPAAFSKEGAKGLLEVEHILTQLEAGIEAHASFFGKPSST